MPIDKLIGKSAADLLRHDQAERIKQIDDEVMESKKSQLDVESVLQLKHGGFMEVKTSRIPLVNSENKKACGVLVLVTRSLQQR